MNHNYNREKKSLQRIHFHLPFPIRLFNRSSVSNLHFTDLSQLSLFPFVKHTEGYHPLRSIPTVRWLGLFPVMGHTSVKKKKKEKKKAKMESLLLSHITKLTNLTSFSLSHEWNFKPISLEFPVSISEVICFPHRLVSLPEIIHSFNFLVPPFPAFKNFPFCKTREMSF